MSRKEILIRMIEAFLRQPGKYPEHVELDQFIQLADQIWKLP